MTCWNGLGAAWKGFKTKNQAQGFLLLQTVPVFLGIVLVATALGAVYGKIVQNMWWHERVEQALNAVPIYLADREELLPEKAAVTGERTELALRDGVKMIVIRLFDKPTGRYIINSIHYVPQE